MHTLLAAAWSAGTTPWWAVPGGVIAGAVLAGVFALVNESRKTNAAIKLSDLTSLRQVCADLVAEANRLTDGAEFDDRTKLDSLYTLSQMTCPEPVAAACFKYYRATGRAETLSSPRTEEEDDANAAALDAQLMAEHELTNTVRREAGLPPLADLPGLAP